MHQQLFVALSSFMRESSQQSEKEGAAQNHNADGGVVEVSHVDTYFEMIFS